MAVGISRLFTIRPAWSLFDAQIPLFRLGTLLIDRRFIDCTVEQQLANPLGNICDVCVWSDFRKCVGRCCCSRLIAFYFLF